MGIRVALTFMIASCCLVLSGCAGSAGSLLGLQLQIPVLTGVSPASVAPGGTVTLSGTNLNGTFTTAYFLLNGTQVSQVQASSGNTGSVTVAVPSSLPAGTYSVVVTVTDANGDTPAGNSNSVGLVVT